MGKSRLFTIFMVVFIGLMGFGFFIPLLPAFAAEFGANEAVQGVLIASYAAAQLIGAPILGRLSDRYGRRPVLLVSVLGTFLSLLMIGFANSLIMLFASRILDGLTGGNISVAQAYITDITDEKNRSRGLGLVGAAFGLGFIIGPALGGLLSMFGTNVVNPAVVDSQIAFLRDTNWTYALPAFGASLIGFINLIQVIFTLPESLTPERRAEIRQRRASQHGSRFSIAALFETLKRPLVGPLLNMRLFYGFAFSLFQSIFPIYAAEQLGLGPASVAYILTYVGVLAVFTQGFAIGKLTDRFDERTLLFTSSWLMAVSLVGWAFAPNVPVLLLVLAPTALAGGIFNTVINSALTKASSPDEIGGILGISTSLESFTRVIAPAIGGTIIGAFGAWSPGILGAITTGLTAIYVYFRILQGPPLDKAKRESLAP
jgi:DHA1 family tetracycline resistance protein-like MFS transporter